MSLIRNTEVKLSIVIDESLIDDVILLVSLALNGTDELSLDIFGTLPPGQDVRMLLGVVSGQQIVRADRFLFLLVKGLEGLVDEVDHLFGKRVLDILKKI